MNPSTLPLNLAALPTSSDRPVAGSASMHRAGGRTPRVAPPSPSMELAARCAREIREGERAEVRTLLFLAGCALVALAGSASYLERCLADWSSFESLVRAALW